MQIDPAVDPLPGAVEPQHGQQRKGSQHNVRCVVVNCAGDGALIPVAAAGDIDRLGQVDHKAGQQPGGQAPFGQGGL